MPEDTKRSQFNYVGLSLTEGREINGLAAGEFTDMYGRAITVEKLEEYVANSLENLEATKTEDGELVGFPIDTHGHNMGDGAGWITGLRQEGNIIKFSVKWTDIGTDLIRRGIRRFFSPTIDTENKVVLGGSLTNWPATRTRKGKILLRPIALSENIFEAVEEPDGENFFKKLYAQLMGKSQTEPETQASQQTNEEDMNMGEKDTPTIDEVRASVLAELSSQNPPADVAKLISAQVEAQVAARLEQEQRKTAIAAFALSMVGGSDDKPIGLPVEKAALESFLLSLTPDQQKIAEGLLKSIHEKAAVDFSETGHSCKQEGGHELPDWAKPMLADWVASGLSIDRFFAENGTELGQKSNYNLSEYQKKES